MDFTSIITALDFTPVLVALTAIAAIMILPGVSRWGYNKVINWFGGEGPDEYAPSGYDPDESDMHYDEYAENEIYKEWKRSDTDLEYEDYKAIYYGE